MTFKKFAALSLLFPAVALLTGATSVSEISSSQVEKIMISAPEAQINITNNPQMKSFRLTLSDGARDDFMIEKRDRQLRVTVKEQGSREELGKFSNKKRILEIQGPAVALEIHLFDGQVSLTKWTKDALVHVQKGKVILKENSGATTANVQKGEIQAIDHQGKLIIDSYSANAIVRNLNGDLNLDNFSGSSDIEKAKGSFNLNQNQGSLKIVQSSGALQFEVGKAQVQSLGFAGRIEGQTQDGPVTIAMGADSEVRIRSQTGRVTVQGGNTGASVNLLSVEGDIYAPSYLKVSRDSAGKTLRGRFHGDTQKGSVSVRSQEGSIVIK